MSEVAQNVILGAVILVVAVAFLQTVTWLSMKWFDYIVNKTKGVKK